MTLNRNSISKNQEWCTPKKYVDVIMDFFNNNIELDPCSNENSIVNAQIKYILPIDGLQESWNFKTIYVNPPYGRMKNSKYSIYDWIKKCSDIHIQFNSEILVLIPVATNTSHWKEFIFNKANSICFLYDTRLKFLIDGSENNKGAPMACCIVYYGNNFDKFNQIFKIYGSVVKL